MRPAALIPDLLAEAARAQPGTVALVLDGTPLTFAGWDRAAGAVAAGLRAAGVRPRQAVWLDLPGWHRDLPGAYLGTLRAGAVAVLGGALPTEDLDRAAARRAPGLAAVLTTGERARYPVPALALSGLLDRAGDPPVAHRADPDDDADICFTSGTTGGRRGVVNSHALLHALAVVDTPAPGTPGAVWHPFGLDTSQGRILTLMAIAARRTTVVGRGRGPAVAADLVTHRPTTVYLSPYLLRQAGAAGTAGFGWVRQVSLVTDAATGADVELARRLFPRADIGTEYGSSEAGVACTKLVYGQGPVGSVGRAAPGSQVRVEAAPGATGAVLLRYPGAPPARYWDDERAGARTFLTDGWVRTGDVGHLDPQGHLYLSGRADEVVLVGGRNVSTPAVARRVAGCAGVRECAVLARPDALLGHRLAVFVVLDAGADLPAVRRRMRAVLPAAELPSVVLAVPRLPRNAAGKVDRGALGRALAAADAGVH